MKFLDLIKYILESFKKNNFRYTITSSDESIAKVGKDGHIELMGEGTVTLTLRVLEEIE